MEVGCVLFCPISDVWFHKNWKADEIQKKCVDEQEGRMISPKVTGEVVNKYLFMKTTISYIKLHYDYYTWFDATNGA